MILYLVFALATAIVSVLYVLNPAKELLRRQGDTENVFVESPVVSGITFFVLSALLAPLVALVLVLPRTTEAMIEGLIAKSK